MAPTNQEKGRKNAQKYEKLQEKRKVRTKLQAPNRAQKIISIADRTRSERIRRKQKRQSTIQKIIDTEEK